MGNKKNGNRKSKIKANNWRGIIRMRKSKAKPNPSHSNGTGMQFRGEENACNDRHSKLELPQRSAEKSDTKLPENQPNKSKVSNGSFMDTIHHNITEMCDMDDFDEYIEIVDNDHNTASPPELPQRSAEKSDTKLPENQPNKSKVSNGSFMDTIHHNITEMCEMDDFDEYIEIVDNDHNTASLPELPQRSFEKSDTKLPENQPNESKVSNGPTMGTIHHYISEIDASIVVDSQNQPGIALDIFDEYIELVDDDDDCDAILLENQPSTAHSASNDVEEKDGNIVFSYTSNHESDPHDPTDMNIGQNVSDIETDNIGEFDLQNSPDEELVDQFQQYENEADVQSTNQYSTAHSESIGSKDHTRKYLSGRRIVEIRFTFDQIRELRHSNTCHVEDMECTDEIRKGLLSTFEFTCTVCGHRQRIDSFNHGSPIDLNSAAVLGITAIGLGAYHLTEFCTNLEIPCMTDYLYDKKQRMQQTKWWNFAKNLTSDALKEEIRLAILNGDIDSSGNVFIVIVCDGSWAKRSYATNFSSLSGCAVMIGVRTNKVLYFDVKDKYCHVCKIAESKNVEPRIHECKKNFVGPSSSMETAIIIEGFQYCDKQGVRFKEYIADGDSSTHKNLTELKIYPEQPIEKDDCCNHLYRNFRSAFGKLGKGTTKSKTKLNKLLTKKKGNDISKGIQTAAKHWRNSNVDLIEKLTNLEKDIFNAPLHYYGVHDDCGSYFCNKTTTPEGLENVALLKKEGKWDLLLNLCQKYFASNVTSLLLNYNNNAAESFNNLVAKVIGGKRINYCLAHSYRSRVARAVVQYNTGGCAGSSYHETHNSTSTASVLKVMEERRKRKCKTNAIAQASKPKKARFTEQIRDKGVHYGENCQKIDMSPRMFDIAKQRYLQPMLDDQAKANNDFIMRSTIGQYKCRQWRDIQSKLLTSWYFSRIIKSRGPASYTTILDDIVYKRLIFSKNADNRHQSIYNEKALKCFTYVHGSQYLAECGLFIDDDHCFLGARPFRLYGDNGIVFIKCPLAAFKKTIQEGINSKLINFWKTESGVEVVNKSSEWYIELQGELHIACKSFAFVVVWVESEFRIEKVYRDDEFWFEKMEQKLVYFYENVMVKEQVDPRKRRQMNLRKYNPTTKIFE